MSIYEDRDLRLELNKKAKETLGSLEKDFNTKQKAEDLSVADQQVVQIARAICRTNFDPDATHQ